MDNRHLTASKGMVLTNGETYAEEVWLGDWDCTENWQELTREEADAREEAWVLDNHNVEEGGA